MMVFLTLQCYVTTTGPNRLMTSGHNQRIDRLTRYNFKMLYYERLYESAIKLTESRVTFSILSVDFGTQEKLCTTTSA